MATGPRIFSVSPGVPFLDALARAILAGDLPEEGCSPPSKLDLPAMTVLLPTRRAARALQEAFLRAGGGRSMLLPAIRPIAESDEMLGLIDAATDPSIAMPPDGQAIPEAIDALERQLALTRLVLQWSAALRRDEGSEAPVSAAGATTPAQAAGLAKELATLMDAVETEEVSLDNLKDLVPDEFAEHWQQTLEFLKIVTEHWPQHLKEKQRVSPARRRNAMLLAEAKRIGRRPLTHPMIVAGVSGSVPATAEIMRAILADPLGAVVLPALDSHLDDASWADLRDKHYDHPQYGFRQLLERLGIERSAVRGLPGAPPSVALAMRDALISQALRPAGTLKSWRTWTAGVDKTLLGEALANVSLVTASSAEEEAEAIALMLRHAVEEPARTAALVTPDRLLARRVAIRLESWGIRVDDSAGRPFRKTVPGAFLDLVADAVSKNFRPAELMSLLKHPLTRLGLDVGVVRRAARSLELAAFRRPYLGQGLAGVETAFEAAIADAKSDTPSRSPARRLSDRDIAAARDLIVRLNDAFAPMLRLGAGGEKLHLSAHAKAHAEVAELLARPVPDPDQTDVEESSPLWREEAGETASRLFERLADPTLPSPALTAEEYPEFYRALVAGETVRARIPVHPRLSIWGPYEARLQRADIMILGSLNDGVWPAPVDTGAWLNRKMRAELGMPIPEQEIGRSAHDLTTFLGAETVVLTRAAKVEGVPMVPSRWLQRLTALLDGAGMAGVLEPKTPWLAWAAGRDTAGKRVQAKPPAPCPPLAFRPRRASVSEIETWIANPYAIYARRVLRLEPLPMLGAEPGPSERGQVIHEALSRFSRKFAKKLPDDVAGELKRIANEVVQGMTGVPRVAAFWLPRLERFAVWFAETEPARRKDIEALISEVSGRLVIEAPGGPFTLTARADRIDLAGGSAIITDYKTGAPPPPKAVRESLAPQLSLEAAMLAAGAFEKTPTLPVAKLRYIRASGGEPPGEEKDVTPKDIGVDALAREALAGTTRLIARFDNEAEPYTAIRRPRFTYDYDDFAHLARVDEWSGGGDDGGGDGS